MLPVLALEKLLDDMAKRPVLDYLEDLRGLYELYQSQVARLTWCKYEKR